MDRKGAGRMNPHRRSPLVRIAAGLVYFFLYAPIFGLMLFSFNSSRTNIFFGGFITRVGPLIMDGSTVVQSPCGPFHWFCELSRNAECHERHAEHPRHSRDLHRRRHPHRDAGRAGAATLRFPP
jgi:ABC-type spermidine/putrescine transport system, permease component II